MGETVEVLAAAARNRQGRRSASHSTRGARAIPIVQSNQPCKRSSSVSSS